MRKNKSRGWRGLYALGLLFVVLLAADAVAHISELDHEVLALAILSVAFGLVLVWTERNADLMESEGIDGRIDASEVTPARPVLYVDGSVIPLSAASARRLAMPADRSQKLADQQSQAAGADEVLSGATLS